MAKNLKKLLSLVLAMIMVLSLIPAVSATETTEPEATEPAATEPVATEPAATEPEETSNWIPSKTYEAEEWIEIQTAEDFISYFAGNATMDEKSINVDANKGKTIGLRLMDDIAVATDTKTYSGRYAAAYIGYYNADATLAFPVNVVLDLNGHTITDTSTNSRMFGIYSGSEFVITNGKILGNGKYTSTGGVFFVSGACDVTIDGVEVIANGYTKASANGSMINTSKNGDGDTSPITIINSRLEIRDDGKTAQHGGLVAITNESDVILQNSEFVGGASSKNGGQVYISSAANVTVTDCTFIGGKSTGMGKPAAAKLIYTMLTTKPVGE